MNTRTNKLRQQQEIKNNLIVFTLFLICTILFIKMNKLYLLSGADIGFHRLRLLGLVQSINNGDYFPKINYIMANGLGYGVPMFYGQWFFYFPALLMITISFTFTRAWLSLYVIYYFVMLIVNYIVARKFLINKIRSIVFSLLLVFNPLITSIVNGDLPFAICLMLTPALFYCLWRIIYFQENKIILLSLIITIVLNTHVLSTIVIAFICLLWVILHANKLNLSKIIILLKSALLSILLSASFWMPLLEQMVSQKLKGSGLSEAFRYVSVHGLEAIFLNSLNDSISSITRYPTISLVGLILYFCMFFVYKKGDEFSKKLFLLISFLLIFSSNLFPWVFFGHTTLGAVQFVGRYLVFALVLILIVSAQNNHISKSVLIFCLFLTFYSTISQQILPEISNVEALDEYFTGKSKENEIEKYHVLNDVGDLLSGDKQVNGVAGGEYLNSFAELSLNNDKIIKSDNTEIFNIKEEHGGISFDYELENSVESSNITIPFLWYKGYKAEYSENGKGSQPSLNYEPSTKTITDDGKISIKVEHSGHVHIFYSKTTIQIISSVISIISWLSLLIFILKKFNKQLKH